MTVVSQKGVAWATVTDAFSRVVKWKEDRSIHLIVYGSVFLNPSANLDETHGGHASQYRVTVKGTGNV